MVPCVSVHAAVRSPESLCLSKLLSFPLFLRVEASHWMDGTAGLRGWVGLHMRLRTRETGESSHPIFLGRCSRPDW